MNTYSLTKDGVWHKLNPLKDKEENVCSTVRIIYIDGRKFLEGMRQVHVFFYNPNVGKEEVEELPIEVTNMLDKF